MGILFPLDMLATKTMKYIICCFFSLLLFKTSCLHVLSLYIDKLLQDKSKGSKGSLCNLILASLKIKLNQLTFNDNKILLTQDTYHSEL